MSPQTGIATRTERPGWLSDALVLCKARLASLVLLTVATGYGAAVFTGHAPHAGLYGLFGAVLGVFLCAAGASVLNQCLECDVDALMARTRSRPLPAGRIGLEAALVFGLALCAAGAVVLFVSGGPSCAALGALSSGIYVLLYTPLKRVTTLNTLVGAVSGALPPVIGWVAAAGDLGHGAWALFWILFVWQLPHFLAIAWLYRNDYENAGLRMLGVVDRNGAVTMRQVVWFSFALIPVSLLPALDGLAGPTYSVVAVMLGGTLLLLSLRLARSRARSDARLLFAASIGYLPLLFATLLLDAARTGGLG